MRAGKTENPWHTGSAWQARAQVSGVSPAAWAMVGQKPSPLSSKYSRGMVGTAVGTAVGEAVGAAVVGAVVGLLVGLGVGEELGFGVGEVVGLSVGEVVGLSVGARVGCVVGLVVGPGVGLVVGALVQNCCLVKERAEALMAPTWQHECRVRKQRPEATSTVKPWQAAEARQAASQAAWDG